MGWKPNIFKHFNWKSHNKLSLLDFVESLLAFVHSSCQGLMLNSHLNLCLPSCPGIFYFSNIQELAWIFQLLRGLKVWFLLSVHWHPCHAWVPHFLIPQQKVSELDHRVHLVYILSQRSLYCAACCSMSENRCRLFFIAACGKRANLALFTLSWLFKSYCFL